MHQIMKHAKAHYKALNFLGYKWSFFDNGKHCFQKKRTDGIRGYWFFYASDNDIDNGLPDFLSGKTQFSNEA